MQSFSPSSDLSSAPHGSIKGREVDVLILGGGLAGTCLAHHLENGGFRGVVAVLDARAPHEFQTEARWATWSEIPESLASLVSHKWTRWEVRDGARRAAHTGEKTPYRHIHAPQFFATLHAAWQPSSGVAQSPVELHLKNTVENFGQSRDGVWATSRDARGERTLWHAKTLFDARGARHERLQNLNAPGQIHWRQSFVGYTVEFQTPQFDPNSFTMMDFGVPQGDAGVRFVYVLPFSPTRALIEVTSFGPQSLSENALESGLRDYLQRNFSCEVRLVARETGDLPMATTPLSPRISENIGAIGLAGGAARAATGYAFGRIQSQTQLLAARLCAGLDPFEVAPTPRATTLKFAALDAIFLEALGRGPDFARDCFFRMVDKVPAASFARFLSETSTPGDEALLIAALPKLAFLEASARRAAAWQNTRKRVVSHGSAPVPVPIQAARGAI